MKKFREFILENDNLSKSQNALDKFGMIDFSELPYIIQEACKKAGLKYDNKNVWIYNFGFKNYTNDHLNDQDIEIIVGMTSNDEEKFDKDSSMVINVTSTYYGDFSFNLVENRNNTDTFIKFLNNWTNIRSEMISIIDDLDSPLDDRKMISLYRSRISKILKNIDLKIRDLLVW